MWAGLAPMSGPHPSPDAILQTAFSLRRSEVPLAAVESGLFTRFGQRRLNGAELGGKLGRHPRGIDANVVPGS